jgi:hypothetical protein
MQHSENYPWFLQFQWKIEEIFGVAGPSERVRDA